ncbi:MAG: TfoX/Sxy family protein [Pseudomonadota bacterium]
MNSFVEYILDILSNFGNIKSREMFGGYGLYSDKIFFAIIADDELYFKADETLAEEYKRSGSYPFTYQRGNKTFSMSYWYVPAEIIEDSDLIKDWYNKSSAVARNKKSKRK